MDSIAQRSARPSLDSLNEKCLLKVFEYLEIKDHMNLAKTCVSLKKVLDVKIPKYSTFVLDRKIVAKGEKYIDGILTQIGRHVTSLTFRCVCKYDKNYSCSRVLNRIDCTKLTSLAIHDLSMLCQNDMHLHSFVNVEILTLKSSMTTFDKHFLKNFLKNFRKLKSLNLLYGTFESDELKMLFKSNPDIESLVVRRVDHVFDCELLKLIPKVEILLLDTFDWYINNLNCVQTLDRITKLRLNCEKKNLNKLMSEMARKGILEELELHAFKVNDKFFEILKSFDKLRLLRLDYADNRNHYEPNNWKLVASTKWPSELQHLRLETFELTHSSFFSTIRQLNRLESIDFGLCRIARSDKSQFKDLEQLSGEITEVIEVCNRQHRLNVVMPKELLWKKSRSKVWRSICCDIFAIKADFVVFIGQLPFAIGEVENLRRGFFQKCSWN